MNEDLPNVESIIAPLNIQEQREAFGGPLYQMMNPSGKKIADAVSGGINSLTSDPTNLMAFPVVKLFKMFPKLRGNPLEVLKETPKIIKKLENKITNQKINISSGAERQKLLKQRSEDQEIINALRKYEKEADDYFRRIVEQPGSMKMSPKVAKDVKEYIKLKDPKKLNINLSKSLDTKEIEVALKRSDISDSIRALNKAEVLQKPGASFSDRLLASDLKKQSKFKSISEALEELDKLD